MELRYGSGRGGATGPSIAQEGHTHPPVARIIRVLGVEGVGFSDAFEAREALVRDMAARPPVDSARVEAMKSAIEAGNYRIDHGRLADAMIRSDLAARI